MSNSVLTSYPCSCWTSSMLKCARLALLEDVQIMWLPPELVINGTSSWIWKMVIRFIWIGLHAKGYKGRNPAIKPSLLSACGLWMIQIDISPWSYTCQGHMVLIGPQVCKWVKFYFTGYLINWHHMTFDLHLWPLTSWVCEGSYIIWINQVWFQSNFNFSNEVNFTFWANLATWPQMTFDLHMWPSTSSTNEGSHVASMTQLWLKSTRACGR